MIDEDNAKAFCKDDIAKIENYQEAVSDPSQTWHIHHRREIDDGISRRELIKKREYFHRPSCELIFLTKSQHMRLHRLGSKLSAKIRKKMSKAQSGENNGFFGKTHSETSKQKMSIAKIGKHHSAESKKKISQALSGRHLSEETKKKISQAKLGEKNPNFGKTPSEETKKKLAGRHWWTNGVESIFAKTCPDGFVKGRICRPQSHSTLP